MPCPAPVLRYARTIHVIYDPPPAASTEFGTLSILRNRLAEERIQQGTLTYAGVVFRLNGERLVLHTRDGSEQPLLLRKDTRYLLNGEIVDPATLQMNTRVFVRAGKICGTRSRPTGDLGQDPRPVEPLHC